MVVQEIKETFTFKVKLNLAGVIKIEIPLHFVHMNVLILGLEIGLLLKTKTIGQSAHR